MFMQQYGLIPEGPGRHKGTVGPKAAKQWGKALMSYCTLGTMHHDSLGILYESGEERNSEVPTSRQNCSPP